MFLLNCLPPPVCVLKHVRTRLIILTGGEDNHKIKIAETGQLAVGIRPLNCKYTFIISEILSSLTTCRGGREGGGGGEKEGTEVKWASHYYMYILFNQYYVRGLSSFISLLISFVSFFQICNSLFSICQVYASFSAFPFTLRRPCKTEIFSVSPLACQLDTRQNFLCNYKISFL